MSNQTKTAGTYYNKGFEDGVGTGRVDGFLQGLAFVVEKLKKGETAEDVIISVEYVTTQLKAEMAQPTPAQQESLIIVPTPKVRA